MAAQGEDVYASLLLTDTYLPGALVLAHSLRDAGTTKKLAILVTLDSVSAEVITQLKAVYDYVIPVSRIRNDKPANLFLMNRPDLHSAFTKINLWKQTQFRKIVYIDSDVVAYRAPDELFDLPHDFSAAPDIGWPDLFNTGVMALTPNMSDYYALMAMADRGISFDGADQGLLNMYFKNTYNRLSFTYNVTPSAHYQYVPAYKHFQSSINMVHFIGTDKPWLQDRASSAGSSPFDEMIGRWWAVYDRHYRREETNAVPELVQYFVKGEYQPKVSYVIPVGEPSREQLGPMHGQHYQPPPPSSHVQQHEYQQQEPPHYQHQHHHQDYQGSQEQAHDQHYEQPPWHHDEQHQVHHHQHHHPPPHHHHDHQHHHHHHHNEPPHYYQDQSRTGSSVEQPEQPIPFPSESFRSEDESHTEAREEQVQGHQQWAPSYPPQPEHKPEPPKPPAPSWDAQRHPPPVDSQPEAQNFPQMHYEMSSDTAPFVPPERYPSPPRNMWYEVPKEAPAPPQQKPRPIFPWEGHQPRASRVFTSNDYDEPEPEMTDSATADTSGSSSVGHKSEPETPTTPVARAPVSDPWTSFTRTNAWDDVPEIERYVDAMQKHRRTRSQGLKSGGLPPSDADQDEQEEEEEMWRRRGSRVTDFPSAFDRPSLPVTPAPIRRPKFWGGGGGHNPGIGADSRDDTGLNLPAAEGVPAQTDWDPVAQLQKLAKQQSEMLLQKLGNPAASSSEMPARPLPFGSEDARSPTYVAHSTTVLSPQPVKPGSGTSSVRNIIGAELEGAIPRTTDTVATIPEPSYSGPGLAFEKGEDIPTFETPALPTEEERDVLDA